MFVQIGLGWGSAGKLIGGVCGCEAAGAAAGDCARKPPVKASPKASTSAHGNSTGFIAGRILKGWAEVSPRPAGGRGEINGAILGGRVYGALLNSTEYWVFSHAILSTPAFASVPGTRDSVS